MRTHARTHALYYTGKNLQAQYERWQPRAKYKMHLDPTMDDVKKLCVSCRRTAKNERVLFHYNGHGVPRPTVNGEIWVFNSRYTQVQSNSGSVCVGGGV
jgi:regulator-associated protein of mTOR